jgi:hypothetical protein
MASARMRPSGKTTVYVMPGIGYLMKQHGISYDEAFR